MSRRQPVRHRRHLDTYSPRKPRGSLSPRLSFSNVNFSATEEELSDLFQVYGPTKKLIINRTADGKSTGTGFVEFLRLSDAERAQRELHDSNYLSRTMKLKFSSSPAPVRSEVKPSLNRRDHYDAVYSHRRSKKPQGSVNDLNKQLSEYFSVTPKD
ncbi:hypothetical protein P9112_014153 [Eukaryota sp. TZLM1-RC]